MKSKVSVVRCASYQQKKVEDAVRKSVELIGGIQTFVKKNYRVLIKPNLLSAKSPESGVDTHPEVVRAVIRLVKEVGGIPLVGDSPGGYFETTDRVYEESGIKKMAEEEEVELVKFDKAIETENIPITSWVKECDVFISVPKLKTHTLTVLTGAVKNIFGVVPGLFKSECHLMAPRPDDFAKLLVDIFSNATPDLSILDGVVGMEGDGPASGVLRDTGLIMASSDSVALDAVLAYILGIKPFDVATTKEAHVRKFGVGDLSEIEIVGDSLPKLKDFKLPQTSILNKIPKPVFKLGTRFIKFRVAVKNNKCTGCGICIKKCPKKIITSNLGKAKIDSARCILCLCCSEVCPQAAIYIKKSLLMKIIGMM